MECNYKN